MRVRQVVTGHDAKGRAVIARDEQIDGMPIPGLGELAVLWSADEPATYPNAGNNPGGTALFPPVGGIRFIMASYAPDSVVAPEPTPGITWRTAMHPVCTGPTRRISGSFSPATS